MSREHPWLAGGMFGARTGASVAAGRRAQGRGKAGEAHAAALNAACAEAGVAELWKFPTPYAAGPPGPDGSWRGRYTEKSLADFVGQMGDGTGRLVVVECKHITVGVTKALRPAAVRLPLARIEPHQRDFLAARHEAGGVAVLLVVTSHGEAFAVHWPAVRDAIDAGRASLDEEALEPWRVDLRRPYLARWARGRA